MELILDTCGLLSLTGLAKRKLSEECLTRIRETSTVGVCACSAFEIAIKHKKGLLPLGTFSSAEEFWRTCIRHYHLSEIPVDAAHFMEASALPDHHSDPFDRLILAAAMRESASVVTYDRMFDAYPVQVLS